MFYVSRQSNYYDDGALSVEIAQDRDYSGPSALVGKYAGEGDESNDPREIAETAIEIAKAWRLDIGRKDLPFRCFTIAGNASVYPTVEDAMTAPELRKWAQNAYNELPKCERCNALGATQWTSCDTGDDVMACSEYCADEMFTCYEENIS